MYGEVAQLNNLKLRHMPIGSFSSVKEVQDKVLDAKVRQKQRASKDSIVKKRSSIEMENADVKVVESTSKKAKKKKHSVTILE